MDAALAGQPNHGWFVRRLVSTLSFAAEGAWLCEEWSIVAQMPLDELLIELNLDGDDPRDDPPDVPIDVHGAEHVPEAWPVSPTGRRMIGIRLPGPLEPGGTHEFHLRVPVPRPQAVGRHVCVPAAACRQLDLRVHFPRRGTPDLVTRVAGRRADGPSACGQVPVDAAGDIAVTFEHLLPGCAYGIVWA